MKYLTGGPATWSRQREQEHIMAKKVDTNQKEIANALRRIGCTVYITSELGKGFPDLTVGYAGNNYLLEVKARPNEGLTYRETVFHETWRGQVAIVTSVQEAIELVRGAA